MSRQIILDTETTGMNPKLGDKLVEIGCVEMIDRVLTGHHFHVYINPERDMPIEAYNVHGLSEEFLQDKPLFTEVADDFLHYIDGSELIIHNAPFDMAFLDFELEAIGKPTLSSLCAVTDTLVMARKMYPGQKNNLDALCKRLGIDNSRRTLHGALLDSEILAQVYLAMTGGQENLFGSSDTESSESVVQEVKKVSQYVETRVIKASESELLVHQAFVDKFLS